MNGPRERVRPASEEKHTFICAWCNVLLRSSPDPGCATVNYGICPRCLDSQLRALTPGSGARAARRRTSAARVNGDSDPRRRAALEVVRSR